LRRSTRGTRRNLAGAALTATALVAVLALSGCGAQTTSRAGASTAGGEELFVQRCGGCHVLAAARTLGTVGPNLDQAFGPARDDGFEDSTFFEVTLEQMKIPGYGSPMPEFDNPDDPDNYLPEEDLVAIAAYVASVAGIPPVGGQPGADDPKALFTTACGSCHVLADAGTSGTVGPNLDDAKPALEAAIAQITNGGGGMPAFKDQLSEAEIQALAQYIVDVTSRRR
jgi:mono/diheme cytochrome c family protein